MVDYKIICEFAKEIKFSNTLVPGFLFEQYNGDSKVSISIDVNAKENPMSSIYMVILHVQCGIVLGDGRILYDINAQYCCLVELLNNINKELIKQILTVNVAQEIYPRVALLVETATSFSGFPPVKLPERYSFSEKRIIDMKIENSCEGNDSIISLEKLMDEIEKDEDGKEFLNTIKNLGGNVSYSFSEFVLTRCLFKFMRYTDYNVNENIDGDDISKKLMFYLIATSDECSWRLERHNEGGIPELYFSYNGQPEKKISDLEIDEFLGLAHSLFTGIMTGIFVSVYLIENSQGLFLNHSECPDIESYRESFYYDSLSLHEQHMVDNLYEKIQKTRRESFLMEI